MRCTGALRLQRACECPTPCNAHTLQAPATIFESFVSPPFGLSTAATRKMARVQTLHKQQKQQQQQSQQRQLARTAGGEDRSRRARASAEQRQRAVLCGPSAPTAARWCRARASRCTSTSVSCTPRRGEQSCHRASDRAQAEASQPQRNIPTAKLHTSAQRD